jgi:predicted transcriptional regulator
VGLLAGDTLRSIRALSKLPSPGPAPAFTYLHVCNALLTIGDEGPIGRLALSRRLGLGEGAIRTIMKHLTQANIISTVREGCMLTKSGNRLYLGLRKKMSKVKPVNAGPLSLDKFNAAIVIRHAASQLKRGIEQRDAAVRAGATGACTLVLRRGEYLMPLSGEDDWRMGPKEPLAQVLERLFDAREGDVVAIVGATTENIAEQGAMAAALTLL